MGINSTHRTKLSRDQSYQEPTMALMLYTSIEVREYHHVCKHSQPGRHVDRTESAPRTLSEHHKGRGVSYTYREVSSSDVPSSLDLHSRHAHAKRHERCRHPYVGNKWIRDICRACSRIYFEFRFFTPLDMYILYTLLGLRDRGKSRRIYRFVRCCEKLL